MAAFLVRAFDLPQAGDAGFSDTAANTHHDAINALAASGITLGYGDGTFRPHQSTTSAQMAAFINRALTSPQDQQPPDSQFSAVTAGGLHSCGLRTDNTIACWGGRPMLPADSSAL